MELPIGLDRKRYTSKPTVNQVKNIHNRMETNITISFDQFAKAICRGQTFRAAVIDKESRSFVAQQIFPLDFDGVPYETVATISSATGIEPAIVYPTFSQSQGESLVRFRAIYISDHVITDERIRNAVQQRLLRLYDGLCDTNCRHYSHLYYGSNRVFKCAKNNTYDFESLWNITPDTFEGWDSSKKAHGHTNISPTQM